MGATQTGQFLLRVPMVAASWKMFGKTVGHLFQHFFLYLLRKRSSFPRFLTVHVWGYSIACQ